MANHQMEHNASQRLARKRASVSTFQCERSAAVINVGKTKRHDLNSSRVEIVSILILCLALVVGCRGNAVVSNSQQLQSPTPHDQSSGPSASMNYIGFKQRLDAGAGCAELFEIRNLLDPKASDVARMNTELREIGCYSSSSIRSITASAAETTQSDKNQVTATFTVNEYKCIVLS